MSVPCVCSVRRRIVQRPTPFVLSGTSRRPQLYAVRHERRKRPEPDVEQHHDADGEQRFEEQQLERERGRLAQEDRAAVEVDRRADDLLI